MVVIRYRRSGIGSSTILREGREASCARLQVRISHPIHDGWLAPAGQSAGGLAVSSDAPVDGSVCVAAGAAALNAAAARADFCNAIRHQGLSGEASAVEVLVGFSHMCADSGFALFHSGFWRVACRAAVARARGKVSKTVFAPVSANGVSGQQKK
jgi:hypothetical protein